MPTSLGGIPVEKLAPNLWRAPRTTALDVNGVAMMSVPWPSWKDSAADSAAANGGLYGGALYGGTADGGQYGGEVLTVRTRVSAADKQYGVLVDYAWTSDGEAVGLRTTVRPDGRWASRGSDAEWALIGPELVLGEEAGLVNWFGQVPHQS